LILKWHYAMTMKSKTYIGIDPGSVSGCIAIISTDVYGGIAFTHTLEFGKMTTKEWYEALKELTFDDNCLCILEKVHGMPGMSTVAVSTFMKNVGHIEMALIALEIPFKEVTPQSWMKHYNMKKEKDESKTDWKRRLRELLQRLMPDFNVKNDTADAMLLAYYAMTNDKD
jgi:Holliday junction resolvasome RuvABC endonuclease subunit